MLTIFNDLKPFFEDNYRRINVREYGRIRKITAPTSSKLLTMLFKQNLLNQEKDRNYIYYYANRDNYLFINLSRIFWLSRLQETGLIDYLKKELLNPLIILFGSFNKAEAKKDSDIDLAIFTPSQKTLDIEPFEKKLSRKIHLLIFKNKKEVKNKELLNNMFNGFILSGEWQDGLDSMQKE